MKKIIFLPVIILLFCSVIVGAYNVVMQTNNRPYRLLEAFQEIAKFEYSIDDIAVLIGDIRSCWSENNVYASAGGDGSGGASEGASDGDNIFDKIVEFFSDFFSSTVAIFKIFLYIIKDTITLVGKIIDIIFKLVIGVPKEV